MALYPTYFGIDSHANTTTVCAVVMETGEARARTFRGNDYGEMRGWMASFPQPSFGVYESGCTGFVPARELTGGTALVVPIATSAIPSSSESRSKKNDRRDAERLARLAISGHYSAVWVPDADTEGLRDLSQAIADSAERLKGCRQRVEALLLKHGLVFAERTPSGRPVKRWGRRHWEWVESADLGGEGSNAALAFAVEAAREAERAHEALLERARQVLAASPMAAVADALQHVKGCGLLTALAFSAEMGDFSRFGSGRKVTSYFGLAPRDRSSADDRRSGGASKCGCGLVRRLLTECAWAHSRARALSAKRGPSGVPAEVAAHAARLSRRLTERRRSMLARGVHANVANTATAAEAARFLWAVGLMAQRAAAA